MANEANHNTLPWVQGNHLELALPMKIVYFTPNGKITQDYEPPTGSTICVEFQSNVNALCFTPTVEGNVLHVTDNGELPVGTYSVNIHVTEPNGDKRCSKLKNSIVVYDANEETVDEFDDFPDWADGAIIDNEVFYFVGTKEIEYVTVDTFGQLPEEGVIGNIYRVANYDGTQVNPHAYAEYYWTGSQYKLLDTKNYGIDEKPEYGSNNLVKSGGIKSSLDEKANKNGYYETLGAGTATNIKGQTIEGGTFHYRTTGGASDVATGAATIEKIVGNTIAWNQLVQNGDFSDGTNGWTANGGTLSVANNILSHTTTTNPTAAYSLRVLQNFKSTPNHIYYACCSIMPPKNTTAIFSLSRNSSQCAIVGNTWNYISVIINENTTNSSLFAIWLDFSKLLTVGDITKIKIPQLFDLTLIYGAGNEPSTPEEFEADYLRWFGKSLTYEPYDAGSLRSVRLSGLKSTGFNLYDHTTGTAKLINYENTHGDHQYQITGSYTALTFTDIYGVSTSPLVDEDGYFSIRENGTLIVTGGVADDTCVHICWGGERDYEYEEHKTSFAPIPITSITGVAQGASESIQVFPYGLKKIGNIKDEIYVQNGKTFAVKRIGSVDLGSLTWYYASNSSLRYFYTSLLFKPNVVAINGKYQVIGWSPFVLNYGGNRLPAFAIYTHPTNGSRFNILDDTYSDASTFNSAMSGVMCDYELEEPIIYELDNFELPLGYFVSDYGTEEVIPEESNVSMIPTLYMRYGINAARTIENLPVGYQSQESMANLLNALGAAMGGTWTTTFDTTTNRYTYTFRRN